MSLFMLSTLYIIRNSWVGMAMQCTTITIVTVIIGKLYSVLYMAIITRVTNQKLQKTIPYVILPINNRNMNSFFSSFYVPVRAE